MLAWRGQRIKFEIVREGRIEIGGSVDPVLKVPLLAVEDQFAEKLLANADRYMDRSVACRDAIDLGYLVRNTGSIPSVSIGKAEAAYGRDVPKTVAGVLEVLAVPTGIDHAADTLRMTADEVREAAANLHGAAVSAWPQWTFAAPARPGERYGV